MTNRPSEISRIVDQLNRAIDGAAWHGDPLMKLLVTVDAEQAARRPIRDAHTIWELVLHIAWWQEVVTRRIHGEVIDGEDSPLNWRSPPEKTHQAWELALAELTITIRNLREAISNFPAERLYDTVNGRSYDFYVMFHGVIQHTLYHAGQIAVLRKAM
jgi:uncharacterized damage-inducible protein DinB